MLERLNSTGASDSGSAKPATPGRGTTHVLAWSGLGRIGPYVTGVGKHIVNMASGLACRPGWDVRLLLPEDLWRRDGQVAPESRIARMPPCRLPMTRRLAETLWQTTRWPNVDRWADGSDWIYCPKELFVPVRDIRYAVTVHDLYFCEKRDLSTTSRQRLQRALVLRPALETATVVLTVSEFTKSRLVELLGVAAGKIRVVGNGVEEGFFHIFGQEPMAVSPFPGTKYVLSVGGLTRKKGAIDLLNFAAALERVDPSIRLVVTGPVEPPFSAQLDQARNIRSLPRGFDDVQMQRLVRGAAVHVVLSEYEGFGIPALEAMAAGVPVIAASRAAMPEVVGDAGVLVDASASKEVAGIASDLIRDDTLRQELIAKGRTRAQQFTWNSCVDRLIGALTEFGPR